MSNIIPLEENQIQITENYRIASIPRNIVLQEKYETSLGRGKSAEKSGQFAYRDVGYYGTINALSNALVNKEVIKSIEEVDKLEDVIEYIEKVKQDILNHINSHITIDLGENSKKASTTRTVKGMKIDVSLENEDD